MKINMKMMNRISIELVKGAPQTVNVNPPVPINEFECKIEVSELLLNKSISLLASDLRGHTRTEHVKLEEKIQSFIFTNMGGDSWDWNWEVVDITIEPIDFDKSYIGLSIN